MKIFYKKDYEEQLKTNIGLNTLYQKLSADLDKANEDNLYLKNQLELKEADEKEKNEKIEELKKNNKILEADISMQKEIINANCEAYDTLKKELEKLKEKGVTLPKKIRATKAKAQTLKETVRPIKR